MRVVVRADAGPERGTGHVMRCLTIAEALRLGGHEVALLGEVDRVEWLSRYIDDFAIDLVACEKDQLPLDLLLEVGAERLVVDSYWIAPETISRVNARIPTMAIIDNDARGIQATWYVDQNLGADLRDWSHLTGRILAGSRYALVRRSVLAHRVENGWEIPGRDSHVVVFMGGTDPGRYMTEVVHAIASVMPLLRLTAVTTDAQLESVCNAAAKMPHATVLGPTSDLPELLGRADAVVSAAGTSSWDVCSMGRPAVLVGVVENQSLGLAHALENGIATGVDATIHGAESVGVLLAELLDNEIKREALVRNALATFDGLGAARVAHALESMSGTQ